METYVNAGRYESLLINERTMSMEMIVEGDVFVSLDVGATFELKREYYLSKCLRGQMWWAVDMIKDPPFGGGQASTINLASAPPPAPLVASPQAVSLAGNNAPGVVQDNSFCADTTGAKLVPILDCTGFVFCQDGKMSGSITMCSEGLTFDAKNGICNWPSATNVCGFEFCPGGHEGYVPFEECSKFYYCRSGEIDGDIDVCADGTLFDVTMSICNWASMVECQMPTPPPTPHPTQQAAVVALPATEPAAQSYDVVQPLAPPNVQSYGVVQPLGPPTPRPTYGTVASAPAANGPSPPAAGVSSSSSVAVSGGVTSTARLTFLPTDDAYVHEEKPYENFNDRFVVADKKQRFDGLLRFYINGLEGRQPTYVKLRLYVVNRSKFGGNFYRCRNDWHEDVVTWDTVPSIIDSGPFAVLGDVAPDEWVEIDVTGLVREDGPVSLRITSDSSDNVMYASKEHTNGNAPELIVGLEPVTAMSGGSDTDVIDLREKLTVSNAVKIGPTDDAFVVRDTPSKSYGREGSLEVDLDAGVRTSYLRFDFSRVAANAVEGAVLRLYCTDSSLSGGLFVTVSDSDWDEETIAYSNAPPADGTVLGSLDEVTAGQWYELDVTNAVVGGRRLTIAILGRHEDRVAYSSKEGQHSPEIILTLQENVALVSSDSKVLELTPTDDATISLRDQRQNFGGVKELRTDSGGEGGMHHFLLRFDANKVPRGQVKSAILRLYATNNEPAFGGTIVEALDSSWDEGTVTWGNAPHSDGRVLGSLAEVEYGSYYDLDVTVAVIGGSPVSFRVSSPHAVAATYGSKETDGRGPRLIVQFQPPDPIPEDFDVYIPTDDASILMDKPTTNFGRDDQLRVDQYGGVYNSLLRFDLSEVERGTVEQAILRLYAIDGSASGGTLVTTKSTDWSQHKVNWFTAPAANGQVIGTLGEVTAYKWYEVDLTSIVEDLGGEPLSIRIAPSHGRRCAYSSSEDRLGHLPQLLIKADMFAGMNRR